MTRLLLIGLMITNAIAENKRLSFEDVQGKSPFEYARLGMMQWYDEKNAYLAWGKGDYKGDIVEVTFPEKDTVTFVEESVLMVDGENLKVSRFSLDKTGTKLLLLSNREKIWRHSYYGTYHVLDVATQTIEKISNDNTRLRNVKMSPDGSKVAYVREDNNLYVYDLNRNREKQLTTNGSDLILNGHFGWVYEEEFGSYDAYRWSQDSQEIAFWEINQ
ncbi:MAG: DPP IV N-terminal domain-containing protein, partial [Candidatus Marinimicrobia bacterium]|nr:DPP IV N-terminal domain-containing protein [Candidatus Neomarinimicrobiota bacterium]